LLKPRILEVAVPTFERRTIYLKRRLEWIKQQRQELDNIKASCDAEARRSAKRLAFGGLGIMVTYWVTIFRLTFWDYGKAFTLPSMCYLLSIIEINRVEPH
jgi:hypothetical protein